MFSIITGTICMVAADLMKIPAILLYFTAGILLGPYSLHLIDPGSLGEGLNVLITVFVSLILFEGGLSLNFNQVRRIKLPLIRQIALTTVFTFAAGWLSERYIAGLSAEISLVFASLTIVTGPTVIKPITRHIPLRRSVDTMLNGEAVLIDAVGAVLAIIVLEYVISQRFIGNPVMSFAGSIACGIACGAVFGVLTRSAFKLKSLSSSPRNILIIGLILMLYYIAETLFRESGLMAVVTYGVFLSRVEYRVKKKILGFKEQVSRTTIGILFILLSANFNLRYLSEHFAAGLVVVAVLIAVRFPVVLLSTHGADFSIRERLFIGWIGPRGIVALAVASIAGMKLAGAGVENARVVELLVFLLISTTVLIQGLSARRLAEMLGITTGGDRNLIILGINRITLALAREWQQNQNDVFFIDSDARQCELAAKEGFPYAAGNALDPSVYEGVDLEHFTSVLAASRNNEINILFCKFVKENYGISNLYTVLTEKATVELSEIIQTDGISPAFGRHETGESAGSRLMRTFLSLIRADAGKYATFRTAVTNPDMLRSNPGEFTLPAGVMVLFVVRNRNCFIYHNDFRFERDDTAVLITGNMKPYDIVSLFDPGQTMTATHPQE